MTTAWIVTTSPEVSTLVALARRAADRVVAVVVGSAVIAGTDAVLRLDCPATTPVEALAPAVADAVAAGEGDLVVVADRAAERSLAGAVAARLGAPVIPGMTNIGPDGVEAVRHNLVRLTLRADGPVVLVADPGAAPDAGEPAASDTPLDPPASYPAVVTARDAEPSDRVDLTTTRRIVALGRGVSEADLPLVREFAAALGAELACSRPVADAGWLGHDRYVGSSGLDVAPELYVALGISGQLQHLSGVTGAGRIVAVNSDPHAPIFALADHGIVGTLADVLPALTTALTP